MGACRSCGAEITWTITAAGKRMPVDSKPTTDGNLVLFHEGDEVRSRSAHLPSDQMRPRHTSHFATCPKADHHRKDRA